jgi:hypothetical protein
MDYEYNNLEELLSLIRDINNKYYKPTIENIIYLEELNNCNLIACIVSLRDAYDHLVKILSYQNIFQHDNKIRIKKNITNYEDHLQRTLFDTYQKILSGKLGYLQRTLKQKDKDTVRMQVALELKRLRLVDQNMSTADKIVGYRALIDFIDAIDLTDARWK